MENLRPLLTTYAYNITGCIDEAQDIVQDVMIKFHTATDTSGIGNPEAYVKRMVINHAINFKKKHKRMLKNYPGKWLPEPIADETAEHRIQKKELLSYSLMVLLEKLNAKQRAVFILKEAFDYGHEEIAEVLGVSEENSRQLLSRAKKQLQADNITARQQKDTDILLRYISVMERGDVEQLKTLLNEDISIIADGGGKVSTIINPLYGQKPAFAYLTGIYRKFYTNRKYHIRIVNHEPALVYYEGETLISCFIFSVKKDKIDHVFVLRNPDKLILLKKDQSLSRSQAPVCH